jgi:hypothetical protein
MFMSRHEHDSMHLNGVALGVDREAIEVKLDELGVRPEQNVLRKVRRVVISVLPGTT